MGTADARIRQPSCWFVHEYWTATSSGVSARVCSSMLSGSPSTLAFSSGYSDKTSLITKATLNKTERALKTVAATDPGNVAECNTLNNRIEAVKKHLAYKNVKDKQGTYQFRKQVEDLIESINTFTENKAVHIDQNRKDLLANHAAELKKLTEFAPIWVIIAISVSLGLGTTIGWKRIAVTIGEKIGNEHLNYAQGASSEIVAASTIGMSTFLGLPVSTTHVLSSGIAGSMVASGGKSNLNAATLRNIGLAWVLTLPVSIVLSLLLFTIFHLFI